MSKKRLLPFLLLSFLLLSATSILAQSSGKIRGTITEQTTGEPIPFANVLVEGTTLGAAADFDGNYVILNVPPGVHSVTASFVGYQKVTQTDVRVNVDFTSTVDFELSSGTIEMDAVVVQGERNPLIRKDLTNPTVAIDEESIRALPVDQISDIIKLQAGVVVDDDGSIHVRGGRSNEIAYTLNGLSLNDPYGNSRSIGLATNAVQEVSVSTGTFNAQFGNALSGVVNYVTKEGSEDYTFSVRGYSGEYISERTELFQNIDDIDPLNRMRGEFTLGGPIPMLNKARFYVSGVYEDYKGSIYGVNLYQPGDSHLSRDNFRNDDPRSGASTDPYFFNPYDPNSDGLPNGDSSFVLMNPSESMNLQGNLSYKFSSTFKVKYEAVYNKGQWQNYSRAYHYNPEGVGTNYQNGLIQSLDITHTVGNNLFYTLKGSYGFNEIEYYLYDSAKDPGYLPSLYINGISNTGFISGGTDNYRSYRKTTTSNIKGDLVWQAFDIHEIKLGFEGRFHELMRTAYSVQFYKRAQDGTLTSLLPTDLLYQENLDIIRQVPEEPSLFTDYTFNPVQLAAYIQDKIEFGESFIVNAGLRYEYFDPDAEYNPNLSENLNDEQFGFITQDTEAAEPKHMLSPRLSMSYPITDRAIIRLSYGHFYQMGALASLYVNDEFYVTNVGSVPTFGNANVEPERSVQYEIGLQQQVTEDMKFDVTGFFKDVSNYIYTQTIYTNRGRQYNVLTNLSYANSRGVTISWQKRRMPGSYFSAAVDYTFSISEGNRTQPSAELFFSEASGKLTETYLVPLTFDRSHVINGNVSFSDPDSWNLGIIFNFQTGTPYTPNLPSDLVAINYVQNSDDQPTQYRVDLKFEKYFTLAKGFDLTLFLQVQNVFDTQNERYVYASSGRALSNVEQITEAVQFNEIRNRINRGDQGLFGIGQVNDFYSRRPERVSSPREIRVGFSLIFN